jgi:hypothetical protein
VAVAKQAVFWLLFKPDRRITNGQYSALLGNVDQWCHLLAELTLNQLGKI